jgi:glycosyltransferase involved in cell wall biosynthesis
MNFSFVIPTRDRAAQLSACMTALGNIQPVEAEWEIIVVDDGSIVPVSGLDTEGRAWKSSRILRESGHGPAAARNAGARSAKGGILIFIDDDCRPQENILAELQEIYSSRPHALVGGRIVHGSPDNFWSSVTHALTEAAYELQEGRDRRPRRFSTSILAVPRDDFLKLAGFDESFARPGGEDYEFCERWQDRGGEALFSSRVAIVHHHPLGFRQFFRQQFNYGRGLIRSHVQGRDRSQRRSFSTKITDIIAMIRLPFRSGGRFQAALVSGGMAASQLFTAMGVARELFSARPLTSRKTSGGEC